MIRTKTLMIPLLAALVILPRLSTDFYLPSLPYIGNDLIANNLLLKMTITIFMFGYALSMLIAGPLSDVFGRKRILMYGLAMYILATFFCAISTTIVSLIIARFFQALGGCCGTVLARVMVKDVYPKEEQIKILSNLSAAMALCPLVISILGGASQFYLGWRAIFFILGLFSLILFIVIKKQFTEVSVGGRVCLKALFSQYRVLITDRLFLGYSLAIAFAWCNYFIFTLESPFLFQNIFGFNSIMFGFIFAVVVLGYLFGTQLTKRLANTNDWDKLIFIATILCFLGAIALIVLNTTFKPNSIFIILPMMLIMIGVGIIIPCTQGAVMQPFTNIAGTASGLFFFIQMAVGFICGFVVQLFKNNSIMPMIIAIFISSTILLIFFYKLIWQFKKYEMNKPAFLIGDSDNQTI